MVSPAVDPRAQAVQLYRAAVRVDARFLPHADVVLERGDELGRGGMGIVYSVLDRRLERRAALKVIHEDRAQDPPTVHAFLREARITAQLDHPAIPQVYEAGSTSGGRHYMLMGVISGRPFSELIREHHQGAAGARGLHDLLGVLLRVVEAVAYAHAQGVIHRDLKPANVMVGDFGDVTVLDWGLALEQGDPEADGASSGTPGYMSPEQAGGEPIDARADVYALGAILCKLLSGALPVSGETSLNLIAATIKGAIEGPGALKRGVPGPLNSLAAKALAADKRQRLESADAFAENLRAYLAGERVPVHRYGLGERVARFVRQHPTLVSTALLGALLVGSAGLLGMRLAQTEADKQAALARVATSRQREAEAQSAQVEAQSAQVEAQRLEAEATRKKTLAEVRRRDAEHVRDNLQQAMSYLQAARAGLLGKKESLPFVQRALEFDRSRYVLRSAAEELRKAGLIDEARKLIEEAITKAPSDDPAALELMLLHQLEVDEAGVGTQATEALNRLVQRERETLGGEKVGVFGGLILADKVFKKGDFAKALAYYERILTKYPTFVWAYVNRGGMRYQRGLLDEALADFNHAIELDPGFTTAYNNRGYTLKSKGRYLEAAADFSRAIALRPSYALAQIGRAEARLSLGDTDGALNDAQDAVASDPSLLSAHFVLARVHANRSQPKALLEALERVPAEGRQSRDYFYYRCVAHVLSGDYGEALKHGEQGLAVDSRYLPLLRMLGVAHYRLGQGAKAKERFAACLKLRPKHLESLVGLGMAELSLGDFEAADRVLSQALARQPQEHEALANRAYARVALGRWKEAIVDAESALRINPRSALAFIARGVGRQELGQLRDALGDFSRALELAQNARVNRRRGYVRRDLNDLEGAVIDWEHYLAQGPADGRKEKVRKDLAAVKKRLQ